MLERAARGSGNVDASRHSFHLDSRLEPRAQSPEWKFLCEPTFFFSPRASDLVQTKATTFRPLVQLFLLFFSSDCLYSTVTYLSFLSHSYGWQRFQCSSFGLWSVWMVETCAWIFQRKCVDEAVKVMRKSVWQKLKRKVVWEPRVLRYSGFRAVAFAPNLWIAMNSSWRSFSPHLCIIFGLFQVLGSNRISYIFVLVRQQDNTTISIKAAYGTHKQMQQTNNAEQVPRKAR